MSDHPREQIRAGQVNNNNYVNYSTLDKLQQRVLTAIIQNEIKFVSRTAETSKFVHQDTVVL
jgi:hypothetical protein